jgi:MFS transporter, DHA1 family, inner membrane transport protein
VRNIATILAIWCAGLGAAAQFGKISVLYDLLAVRYGDQGAVALGLMVSIVGMVGLVFGTTAGIFVARIGPRRAIVAALAMGAAVSLGQMALPPYPVMMALRVAEGVSHLAIVVVGPTAIAGVAGARHIGLAMTLWSSFFGVTYALLALAAPPLVAAQGPGALFALHGLWMAACALALARMLPADPAAPVIPDAGSLMAQHRAIYASPFVAAPALGFVCYTAIYVALLTLAPPLFPPADRALVAAGMPIVSIAVSLTLGVWLLGRMTPVRAVQWGFAVAIAGLVLFALALGQPGVMMAAVMIVAAALGIVQGASFAAIPALNPAPQDRARAAGAVAQLGNLGTTSGTPLLALILAATGPIGIVIFALPLCVLGIVVHGWLARRRLHGAA